MFQAVLDKIEEVETKLEKLGFPKFGFGIQVEIGDLPPGVAGQCHYYANKVVISKAYLETNREEVINQTVPHEVVHLYVNRYFQPKQAHGKEFRRLMVAIGCRPDTYHNMARPDSQTRRKMTKYVYICSSSGKSVNLSSQIHKKMLAGQKRFLVDHPEGRLVFTGKVVKD